MTFILNIGMPPQLLYSEDSHFKFVTQVNQEKVQICVKCVNLYKLLKDDYFLLSSTLTFRRCVVGVICYDLNFIFAIFDVLFTFR